MYLIYNRWLSFTSNGPQTVLNETTPCTLTCVRRNTILYYFIQLLNFFFINFQRLFKNLFLQEIITMLFEVSEFIVYYVHLYRNVVKLIDRIVIQSCRFCSSCDTKQSKSLITIRQHTLYSIKSIHIIVFHIQPNKIETYIGKIFLQYSLSQNRYLFLNVCMAPKTICGGNISQIWGYFNEFLDNEIIHQLFQSEWIR